MCIDTRLGSSQGLDETLKCIDTSVYVSIQATYTRPMCIDIRFDSSQGLAETLKCIDTMVSVSIQLA